MWVLELELQLENSLFDKNMYNYTTNRTKNGVIKLYIYGQEIKAKVQQYHQSHLVGHVVSWVDPMWRRLVSLVLVSYVLIKIDMLSSEQYTLSSWWAQCRVRNEV